MVQSAKIQKVLVWIARGRGSNYEVLLLQTQPVRGGLWQPVTGWVETGEPALDAARREVSEETDFAHLPGRWRKLGGPYVFESRGQMVCEQAYAFYLDDLASLGSEEELVPQLDASEHQNWKWVETSEALLLVPYSSQRATLEHLCKN